MDSEIYKIPDPMGPPKPILLSKTAASMGNSEKLICDKPTAYVQSRIIKVFGIVLNLFKKNLFTVKPFPRDVKGRIRMLLLELDFIMVD